MNDLIAKITTMPGILILCGVILLVIAIILFIAGSKKSKKEKKNNELQQASTESVVSPSSEPMAQAEVSDTATNVVESVAQPDLATNETVSAVEENVNPIPDVQVENTIEPVIVDSTSPVTQDSSVETTDSTTNAFEMPAMEPVTSATPIEEPAVEAANTESSSIYGGENPTMNIEMPQEKPVTIYGGNDPLEATQNLPQVEEHHEPYGGESPEVKITEPTIEATTPEIQPVEIPNDPVVEIPVEVPSEPTPAIVEQPVEEPSEPAPAPVEQPVEVPSEPAPASVEQPVEVPSEPAPAPVEPPVEVPSESTEETESVEEL